MIGGAYLETPGNVGAGAIPSLSCFLLFVSVMDAVPLPIPVTMGLYNS